MLHKINKIEVLQNFSIGLTFDDGKRGIIDIRLDKKKSIMFEVV